MRLLSIVLVAGVLRSAAGSEPDLNLIPPYGGFSMTDVRIGKSTVTDFRGGPYYFFVLDPTHDMYVSKSMLNGGWENWLSDLFDRLLAERTHADMDLPVLDIGANFGSFSLFAASKHVRVHAFEMQPYVYTLLEVRLFTMYHLASFIC